MNIERAINKFIKIDGNGFFICPFCSEAFRALAYHTRQVHNIKARKLREMFGLPYNYSLQVEPLKQLRRYWALEYNMGVQLKRVGIKTRFKYGKLNKNMIERIRRGHIKNIRKVEV